MSFSAAASSHGSTRAGEEVSDADGWRVFTDNRKLFSPQFTLLTGQCFNFKEVKRSEESPPPERSFREWVGIIDESVIGLREEIHSGDGRGLSENPLDKQDSGKVYWRRWWPLPEDTESPHLSATEAMLRDFFTFDVDMEALRRSWSQSGKFASTERGALFNRCLKVFQGLRVTRQSPFECFATFMLSANNNIKRISLCCENLRQRYGTFLCYADGLSSSTSMTLQLHKSQLSVFPPSSEVHSNEFVKLCAFPSPEQLAKATEAELREIGLGYRAPRLLKAAETLARESYATERAQLAGPTGRFVTHPFFAKLRFPLCSYDDAAQALMEFDGVGQKVADCIMLFSLDHADAIPIDTHIRQVAESLGILSGPSSKHSIKLEATRDAATDGGEAKEGKRRSQLRHKLPPSLTPRVYREIAERFKDRLSPYAGWAQSFLFTGDLPDFKIS